MPRGTHCVEKLVFRDVQDDLGVMCAGNLLFLLTLDFVNTLNPLTQGVVGSPQRLLDWGSHRSGRAELPHPAPQVRYLLSDGKYCERCVPGVKGSV